MADFPAAPFYSADDLTGRPGDPALGGVQQNYDPAVKKPLEDIQNTFTRLDTENNQAIQQQKERAFQAQQQKQREQNDILKKHMEYDHEDKVQKAINAQKDKQMLFGMLNQTGGTASTLKDESGNDMSLPYLPDDQDQLDKEAKSFQDWALKDPSKNLYSSDLQGKMTDMKHKRTNATMRSVYYKQAQQQLQNTFDPDEQSRIQDYMEKIKTDPITKMPDPYLQRPTVKPMIDVQKDYKDGKGMESFDDGDGVPNSRYLGLAATTDPGMINEGFKRYQFFQKQPEGQSAQAYQAWKQNLDALTAQRGLPPIDLGATMTQDGKVMFDDATYAKKQSIARKMLAATELMNNGYLKTPDEDDQMKTAKTKAEINEIKARTSKLSAEADNVKSGKSSKPLTPTEAAQQAATKATVNRIKTAFDPSTYQGYGTHLQTEPDKKGKFDTNTVEGVDVYSGLKSKGYNPADWTVFKTNSDDIKDLSGMAAKSGDKGKEKPTGQAEPSDKIFALKNSKTGDIKLAYFKKGKKDSYDIQSVIGPREAVGNAARHKHNYKDENSKMSDEISRNEAEFDNSGNTPQPSVQSNGRPSNVPAAAVYNKEKGLWIDKAARKAYTSGGEEVKRGT